MDKRWRLLAADEEKVRSLQAALGISPVICRLLVQRGIETFDQARSFFRPALTEVHDPFLMKDMDRAVERLLEALDAGERVLVLGDYDVDGTTAVACLYHFLRSQAEPGTIGFYIPNRYTEGYGISARAIDHAAESGYKLVVSLDCGIKSVGLIARARELGIDFIVCDHHLPDAELPPALAILNPKQPECPYPYKDLCGCGIGFKLICALCQVLGAGDEEALRYLDLVATAIAADIVPMTGENRVLAFFGLERVNRDANAGIRALMELSGIRPPVSISDLVFMIAPRVNAAGRMDDARKAVDMFLAETPEDAKRFAQMLHSDNDDRSEKDKEITREALALIEAEGNAPPRKSTVVFQPHWHKGVVGIVASRLIEKYYRPTVVLTKSGDLVAGSARSVPGFNLYEAIHATREHLVTYGGHFAAAGLSLRPEEVEKFRARFEEVVAATITEELLTPEIAVSAELTFGDLTEGFYRIIRQMEPFGPDNPRPVFLARGLTDTGHSRVLKEQHLRFAVRQGSRVFYGIGFGLAHRFPLLEKGKRVDLAFTLEENEWNGTRTLQLRVVDVRATGE